MSDTQLPNNVPRLGGEGLPRAQLVTKRTRSVDCCCLSNPNSSLHVGVKLPGWLKVLAPVASVFFSGAVLDCEGMVCAHRVPTSGHGKDMGRVSISWPVVSGDVFPFYISQVLKGI